MSVSALPRSNARCWPDPRALWSLAPPSSALSARCYTVTWTSEADSAEPVDAVFASNDNYAALALGWARTRGIRVPEDFRPSATTGAQTVQLLMPELATVIQPIEGIAQRAVQRLLELIERQDASTASAAPADSTSEGSAYLPGMCCPSSYTWGPPYRTTPRSLARGAGHLGAGRTAVALSPFFPKLPPPLHKRGAVGANLMLGSCGALSTDYDRAVALA